MKVLHLDSSIMGGASVSRDLSAALVAKMKSDKPDLQVTYHDLAADPISHLSGATFAAQAKSPEDRSDDEARDVAMGERVMREFMEADIIVIGSPMYNFSVSGQLKSWIDRILVAGKTFRYSATGAEGLAGGKKVVIASSRGGVYSEGPAAPMDFQETYLRSALGFIGIKDVDFIRAEGIAMGPEQREKAVAAAQSQIQACPAPSLAA